MTARAADTFVGKVADLDLGAERFVRLGFDADAALKVWETLGDVPTERAAERIADLKALGFADPVKMITSLPAILGLAIDNIRGKIADLKALGFADPVKMITSLPAILGYAIDNIRGKIADLKALGFEGRAIAEGGFPQIFSYAPERLALAGGVVRRLEDGEDRHLVALIVKRREVIERVALAAPRTWAEARAAMKRPAAGASIAAAA
jgi:hypothetical protein